MTQGDPDIWTRTASDRDSTQSTTGRRRASTTWPTVAVLAIICGTIIAIVWIIVHG